MPDSGTPSADKNMSCDRFPQDKDCRKQLERRHKTNELIDYALKLGASDAKIISVKKISIEDDLPKMCEKPGCDGYGQSVNCPPHVMKPDRFRQYIGEYKLTLVFKFDISAEKLISDNPADQHEPARIIHETAASIEQFSIDNGYSNSQGLAAGPCKLLFCSEYDKCSVLTEYGKCRFPDLARPSMSGLGINFFELAKIMNWQISRITKDSDPEDAPTALMAGMVLIG
ncbi:MAG: DUF2284 domain-containing protein [Thermodesulfobacteriota bacterium]|nr:DUF2284 domain-containing protein [Thermodesulfobacteriota bacterium]